MSEIKMVERLRAALAAEREAAEAVVEYPVEATDAPYRDAKAATDRLVAKIERTLKRCAEQTRDRILRGEEGVPTPSGKGGPGDGGLAAGGLVGHGMNVVGGRIQSIELVSPPSLTGGLIEQQIIRGIQDRRMLS